MRADKESTLAAHLVANYGKATPFIWLTFDWDELKSRRNDFADACPSLCHLAVLRRLSLRPIASTATPYPRAAKRSLFTSGARRRDRRRWTRRGDGRGEVRSSLR